MEIKLGFRLIALVTLLSSCGSEWISDPIDPRLPMYTEDGNNVAGAFIDGTVWRAARGGLFQSYSIPQLDVDASGDSLSIEFKDILFVLRDIQITSIDDISSLAGRKFLLGPDKNGAYFGGLDYRNCVNSGVGQFFLRTVKETDSGMIMAGTFYFTIDHPDCGRIEVTHGRFDFKIG